MTPSTLNATDSAKNAMPNDMANRGCRTVSQIGLQTRLESPRLRLLHPSNARLRRSNVHPQALGVNARCGCQDIGDQTGWRLHLREILQPVAARLDFGEQRPAGGTSPRVSLEAVELSTRQDAIERVREQAVKLDALHSVTGVVWHHITCL